MNFLQKVLNAKHSQPPSPKLNKVALLTGIRHKLLVESMNKLKLIIKKIGKPFYVFLYNSILGINLKYPHYDNLEVAVKLGKEWQEKFRSELKINTTSLDVGCGTNPRNPFLAKTFMGVDIIKSKENYNGTDSILIADLSSGNLPFEDNTFDFITAFDFLEHLSRQNFPNETLNPFVQFMNEVSRILNSGGVFLSHTPAFPFEVAFSDPTHQNIITETTFPYYFSCFTPYSQPWAKMYGFKGELKLITQYWLHDHLITVLGKE